MTKKNLNHLTDNFPETWTERCPEHLVCVRRKQASIAVSHEQEHAEIVGAEAVVAPHPRMVFFWTPLTQYGL